MFFKILKIFVISTFSTLITKGVVNSELLQNLPIITLPTLLPTTTNPTQSTPKPKFFYTSYWNKKTPYCLCENPIIYPTNQDQIKEILYNATINKKKVKAFGHRHSVTDIYCTNGIPICMSNIIHKKIDNSTNEPTVTVGAGLSIGKLADYLHNEGYALECSPPAYDDITVGGATGTGAHGSSVKHPSGIYELVISMTVISQNGTVSNITGEDLKYYKTHLGLLGIIWEVELKIVKDFHVQISSTEMNETILLDEAAVRNILLTSDSVTFMWIQSQNYVVNFNCKFLNKTDQNLTGVSNFGVPAMTGILAAFGQVALESAQESKNCLFNEVIEALMGDWAMSQSLATTFYQIPPILTENGKTFKNNTVGYPSKMLITSCSDQNTKYPLPLNCVWNMPNSLYILDSEIVIDLKYLAGFYNYTKELLKDKPAYFILGIIIKFSRASEVWMSTAYSNNSENIFAHIEFITYVRKNDEDSNIFTETYQTLLQTLIYKYHGRSHWGKSGHAFHSKDILQDKFPIDNLNNFRNEMTKVDPDKLFENKFAMRFKNIGSEFDLDLPIGYPAAIYDNSFCKLDSCTDCGTKQYCVKSNDTGVNCFVCRNKDGLTCKNITPFGL